MKGHHMPEAHTAHPNVTPLIDVVMCLIIFFMLIAKIGVNTGAEAMVIPESVLGTSIQELGNTLTLNVREGGAGDEPMVTALVDNEKKELKIADIAGRKPLTDILRRFRYGPTLKPGGKDENPNFSVIIRAPEDLPYKYLEPVLIAAAEANVKNVNFNTRKKS